MTDQEEYERYCKFCQLMGYPSMPFETFEKMSKVIRPVAEKIVDHLCQDERPEMPPPRDGIKRQIVHLRGNLRTKMAQMRSVYDQGAAVLNEYLMDLGGEKSFDLQHQFAIAMESENETEALTAQFACLGWLAAMLATPDEMLDESTTGDE